MAWAVENRERKNANQRAYLKRNKVSVQERKNKWTSENWDHNLWSQAKRRAKREGIDFDLQRSDIIIPEKCPYLEIPLTRIWGHGQLPTNASIDRIDNSKGYVKDNIQIISRLANTMKSNSTKEQLLTFAKNVIALEGGQAL